MVGVACHHTAVLLANTSLKTNLENINQYWIYSVNSSPHNRSPKFDNPCRSELVSDWLKFTRAWFIRLHRLLFRGGRVLILYLIMLLLKASYYFAIMVWGGGGGLSWHESQMHARRLRIRLTDSNRVRVLRISSPKFSIESETASDSFGLGASPSLWNGTRWVCPTNYVTLRRIRIKK